MRRLALLTAALLLAGCSNPFPDPTVQSISSSPSPSPLTVLDRLPHDPDNFTQGLVVVGDEIVETTGQVGHSKLSVMGLDGTVKRSIDLPDDVFGEGVAVGSDTVWVLTWKDDRILRYTWPELEALPDLPLETQGWGACLDDGTLWTSDGSATISARETSSGAVRSQVEVTMDGSPVERLNELECNGDGTAWANIWKSDQIVRISLDDGEVVESFDASVLAREVGQGQDLGGDDVLNGIAKMPDGSLLLTGKRWDTMFVVDLPSSE